MRWSWLLVLVLVAGDALADRKESSVLSMEAVDGEDIHIAGGGGAINRHSSVQLEVEIFSTNHKVNVSDIGTRSENNLYPTYSTEEKTDWYSVWSGKWSLDGDVMSLDLELYKNQCTHTKEQTGAQPEKRACGTWSAKVQIRCTSDQVKIEDPDRPARKAPVWRCRPSGAGDLGETPATWILGKPGCVQVMGGGRSGAGDSYRSCSPGR